MKLQPLLLSRCKIKAWTVCWSLKICKTGRICMARYPTRLLWWFILVTEGEFLLTIRLQSDQSDNCMVTFNILIWPRLYHNRTAYLGYPEGFEVNIHIMSNLWQCSQNWHEVGSCWILSLSLKLRLCLGDFKSWDSLRDAGFWPWYREPSLPWGWGGSCKVWNLFLLIRIFICKTAFLKAGKPFF